MPRLSRLAAVIAILVAPICSLAHAQDPGQYQGYYASPNPLPVGPVHGGMSNAWGSMGPSVPGPGPQGFLDAPLYPCPKPDVPREVGGTLITNPAFDPHEMLYAHQYRALYGPYYYKDCSWFPCCTKYHQVCMPEGAGPNRRLPHNVKLVGTEVRVKYHSHYTPFSGFFAPKTWGGKCP